MRPQNRTARRAMALSWLLLCFLFPLLLQTGCANDVEVYLKEEFDVTLDLTSLAKKALSDKNIPASGKLPPGFKLEFPFFLSKSYNLKNNEKIKTYKDYIVGVKLNQVTYYIQENTLNVDLPGTNNNLDVFVATRDENQKLKDYKKIGFLFPIPSAKSGVFDRLQFVKDGEKTASDAFKSLSFSFALSGLVSLDAAQSREVPKGRLSLVVTLDVTFLANVI